MSGERNANNIGGTIMIQQIEQRLKELKGEFENGQKMLAELARIIHEHFCCNRGFAAATSLDAVGPASRQAGSPFSRSTSCSRMPPSLAAPRACLGPPPSPTPILGGREGWGAHEPS